MSSSVPTLFSLAHPDVRWSDALKDVFRVGMAAAVSHLDERREDDVLCLSEGTPGIVRAWFEPRARLVQQFKDAGMRPLHSLFADVAPGTLRVFVQRASDGGEMGACQVSLDALRQQGPGCV